jgi:hypothetical protein
LAQKKAVRLAADANPLLAAVLGGRAGLILRHPKVDAVFTTEETYAEVEEYASVLATEKRLDPGLVLLAVASLPVRSWNRAPMRTGSLKLPSSSPSEIPTTFPSLP